MILPAKQILKEKISLSKYDLIRETAKLFSFSKVGSIVDIAMRQGIQLADAKCICEGAEWKKLSAFEK